MMSLLPKWVLGKCESVAPPSPLVARRSFWTPRESRDRAVTGTPSQMRSRAIFSQRSSTQSSCELRLSQLELVTLNYLLVSRTAHRFGFTFSHSKLLNVAATTVAKSCVIKPRKFSHKSYPHPMTALQVKHATRHADAKLYTPMPCTPKHAPRSAGAAAQTSRAPRGAARFRGCRFRRCGPGINESAKSTILKVKGNRFKVQGARPPRYSLAHSAHARHSTARGQRPHPRGLHADGI